MKTLTKLAFGAVLGAAATAMLSADTRKKLGEAADGVKADVKAKAKKATAATVEWWKENVDPGPKPPTDTKDTPPSASA